MRFKFFKTFVLTLTVFVGLGAGYALAAAVFYSSYNNMQDVWTASEDAASVHFYLEHYPGYNQQYNQGTRTYVNLKHETYDGSDHTIAYRTATDVSILDHQDMQAATNTPPPGNNTEFLELQVGGTKYVRTVMMSVGPGTWYDVYVPYIWEKSNFVYDWEEIYVDSLNEYYWSVVGEVSGDFSPFSSIEGITLSD